MACLIAFVLTGCAATPAPIEPPSPERAAAFAAFAAACAVDELMGLGFDSYKRRKEDIEKVSLDDTRRVAAKFFSSENAVEATVLPPEKNQPTENK
mgnify:CR=1 FL=1